MTNGPAEIFDAVEQGNVDRVKAILIRDPAQVSIYAEELPDMPLHAAAEQGHVEVIQILLSFGARIDAKGDNGRTALHYAALNGHTAAAQELVRQGADIEARDESWNAAYSGLRARARVRGSCRFSFEKRCAVGPQLRLSARK